MKDENIAIRIENIYGEQIDYRSKLWDAAGCRKLLAQAGYPDGYPGFRLMVWPAEDSLITIANEVLAYFSDCKLGEDILIVGSYQDAFTMLRQNIMAGESGILISIWGE